MPRSRAQKVSDDVFASDTRSCVGGAVSEAEVEAADEAYSAYFERFVIYSQGFGISNRPESVVDEATGETVFGPAAGAREWNQRQATRAALGAAAKVRKEK